MMKRKRSEGVVSPELRSIEYSRSIEERQEAMDGYRIIWSTYSVYEFRAYLLEIPFETVDAYRKLECNAFSYVHEPIPRSPTFLADTPLFVYGKPVALGSTIYALAMERVHCRDPFDLLLVTLNLESEVKNWEVLKPDPMLQIQVTLKSVIAPLCGLLYVLGAYPYFGYIYDPGTQIWSVLEGPSGVTLNTDDVGFLAPLGGDKILVNDGDGGYIHLRSNIRIYDVPSNLWETYDGESLGPYVWCLQILDSPLVVHHGFYKNPTLCFMDRLGTFYAFDWNNLKLFKAPVSGFTKLCGVFEYGDSVYTAFLHFGGDLFCFCFPTYKKSNVGCTTRFHYVFLRVKIVEEDSTLEGFVVGCFEDSMEGDLSPYGAFFV